MVPKKIIRIVNLFLVQVTKYEENGKRGIEVDLFSGKFPIIWSDGLYLSLYGMLIEIYYGFTVGFSNEMRYNVYIFRYMWTGLGIYRIRLHVYMMMFIGSNLGANIFFFDWWRKKCICGNESILMLLGENGHCCGDFGDILKLLRESWIIM